MINYPFTYFTKYTRNISDITINWNTTKYDDSRSSKELDNTTVSGFAPLKDQGFCVSCSEGRIVLKDIDESYAYRRVCLQS